MGWIGLVEVLASVVGWLWFNDIVMARSSDCVLFWRPFLKRVALCYRMVVLFVCLSVLSVLSDLSA